MAPEVSSSLRGWSASLLYLSIFLASIAFHGNIGTAADSVARPTDIEVFTSTSCPHCGQAKIFLQALQHDRPDLLISLHEIEEDPNALARLNELATERGIQTVGVPAFLVRGELLIGFGGTDVTGARILALLEGPHATTMAPPEGACVPEVPSCRRVAPDGTVPQEAIDTAVLGRLSARELGLPLFTIAVGLLDGFNPCAMWVLLFLLSLLATLRDRRKMTLVAATFVGASGLVYFSFMAAWLNMFFFVGLSRTVQVILGFVAGIIGGINIKDFFAFRQGVSLSIPAFAKPGIYAKVRRIVQAEALSPALIGVAALAVTINMVELLCTAGFPAVYTQILALHRLSAWQYYGYLALYNLAYIVDDALMVTIAVLTLGRRKLQEREGRRLKLISGIVMLVLGLLLILKPESLGA